MPRWLAIFLGVVPVAGVAALALSSGAAGPSPLEDATVKALTVRVRNRKRLNGTLDQRLMDYLAWWDAYGPFMITVGVDGGIRTDEAKQRSFCEAKVSNACTLRDTAHAYRGAVDLWVYKPESVTAGTFVPDFDTTNPEVRARYTFIGEAAEKRGLVWGGRWKKPDWGHLEVPNWRSLPFVGGGGVA